MEMQRTDLLSFFTGRGTVLPRQPVDDERTVLLQAAKVVYRFCEVLPSCKTTGPKNVADTILPARAVRSKNCRPLLT